MSPIGAAQLMQEQLKVDGFWSQLDANNGEDDDEGGDNVVDEDEQDGGYIFKLWKKSVGQGVMGLIL